MTEYKIKGKQKDEILRFSASKINLFFECPHKFAWTYLSNLPRTQTNWPGTGFGIVTHEILEYAMLQRKNDVAKKDIINDVVKNNLWTKNYDKWLKENSDTFKKSRGYKYDEFIVKGEKFSKLLTTFVLNHFEEFVDVFPELEFTVEYPFVENVNLTGLIDLPIETKDGFRIFDFKTTKDSNKFYFTPWDTDVQSLIYSFSCYSLNDKFPIDFTYLVLNHEEKTVFFKQRLIDGEINPEEFFQNLTNKIEEVKAFCINPNLTLVNPEETKCRWCGVKDLCPGPWVNKKWIRK